MDRGVSSNRKEMIKEENLEYKEGRKMEKVEILSIYNDLPSWNFCHIWQLKIIIFSNTKDNNI